MRILEGSTAESYVRKLEQRGQKLDVLEPRVRRIVQSVRRQGDRALRRYAEQWDGLNARESLRVSEDEMKAALKSSSRELRAALETAAGNIRNFCEWQKPASWERTRQGRKLGQLVRPLSSVGCYVPGGRYPLPSTLLMTVIPAQVAGVQEIRVVSPRPAQATLAAAVLLGVSEFYRIGGAQAIAALAYGTKTVPRVNKIVGPGNLFVTAAKKIVAFDCAIDFLAGPTEGLILCDQGEPSFIASDLVAQAEHDPDALVLLITRSRKLARSVSQSVTSLARGNSIAEQSLRKHGAVLLATSSAQAIGWANLVAPEHLTTTRENLPGISSAGSIFLGDYSAQAAGDYGSGPNHVLPTGGVARFRGGLSVIDFVKVITVQELSRTGLRTIAPSILALAKAEGLRAHGRSIELRCARAEARQAVRKLKQYQPPLGDRSGLRLDFNENTGGCSPKVIERLRQLQPEQMACYPEREPVEREVASFFGVQPEQALLTNGVDEAIHLVCEAYLEPKDDVLIVVPTFAMYQICAGATGARVVSIPTDRDFRFPTAKVMAYTTAPKTRLIAIANPNNPTGAVASVEDLLLIARSAPQAAVLVDEAYFEFYGESLLEYTGQVPNLFIARTFSKAYGMASLRVGVLAGAAEQIRSLRRSCSPYNVNGLALACLPAALADQEYVRKYIDEVRSSRSHLEEEFRAWGIPFWPSQANFVLARIGASHANFVQGMRRRGILVRDRSSDFGCEGCVRITTGWKEHTERLLVALRETLKEIGWGERMPA